MCKDCHTEFIDVHSGMVSVGLSGWGTWSLSIDAVPEGDDELPVGPLLGPRDALRVAWALAVAAVKLRWLIFRDERHWPKAPATVEPASPSDGA